MKDDTIRVMEASIQIFIQNLYGHSAQMEGEEKMTDLIEEYAQKIAKQVEYEKKVEVALSLLADGMSVEFAAKHSKLSLDEVRKLAEKRSA